MYIFIIIYFSKIFSKI